MEKVILKLSEASHKTTNSRHFNRKFSNNFSALWVRPDIYLLKDSIYLLKNISDCLFSVFLSYKVLRRQSSSDLQIIYGGGKKCFLNPQWCFDICCCHTTTFRSRFCSSDTCCFWQASGFAHDHYLPAKLWGSNVAGDKCCFLTEKEDWGNIVGSNVCRKTCNCFFERLEVCEWSAGISSLIMCHTDPASSFNCSLLLLSGFSSPPLGPLLQLPLKTSKQSLAKDHEVLQNETWAAWYLYLLKGSLWCCVCCAGSQITFELWPWLLHAVWCVY